MVLIHVYLIIFKVVCTTFDLSEFFVELYRDKKKSYFSVKTYVVGTHLEASIENHIKYFYKKNKEKITIFFHLQKIVIFSSFFIWKKIVYGYV